MLGVKEGEREKKKTPTTFPNQTHPNTAAITNNYQAWVSSFLSHIYLYNHLAFIFFLPSSLRESYGCPCFPVIHAFRPCFLPPCFLPSVLSRARTSLDGFRESIHRYGRWFCQCLVDLERKVFDAVVQFLFEGGPTVIRPFIDRSQRCFAPEYT